MSKPVRPRRAKAPIIFAAFMWMLLLSLLYSVISDWHRTTGHGTALLMLGFGALVASLMTYMAIHPDINRTSDNEPTD